MINAAGITATIKISADNKWPDFGVLIVFIGLRVQGLHDVKPVTLILLHKHTIINSDLRLE